MQRLAVAHAPNEVGTCLVGQYSRDGHEAVVVALAPLTPDSKAGQWSFVRGIVGLRAFFESTRHRFRGRRHRVGEWHSHPNAAPTPSAIDDDNQMELARTETERLPEAILIIIGHDLTERPSLGVSVYSRTRGRIELTSFR
jgi:hypothetical protein